MISPAWRRVRSWLIPDRSWSGRKALVPAATCHRILDVILAVTSVAVTIAFSLGYAQIPELLRYNPLFWCVCSCLVPGYFAAVFRGWPFAVRYGCLVVAMGATTLGIAMVVGITPNWDYQTIFLVAATSLFWGARAGIVMIVGIFIVHIFVAWGWVAGRLPAFMPKNLPHSPVMDFSLPMVWTRLLLVAALSQGALVAMMRYVLGDLNQALRQANDTLQMLAVEQERRARAEEARLQAERTAREAQKFDALGRLASGVAHDFNNALCVIKCWVSFLGEHRRDPEVVEASADIRRATENAEQLTQHLLAFSRSEAARRQVVDLAEVVRLEGRTLARLLPKNVAVVVDAPGEAFVRLGRGQLQELLLNLAINARDAMPQGGRLEIATSRVEVNKGESTLAAGPYVRLTVKDTGDGMDDEVRTRIFEPFFTTKGLGKGTGLGLSMVYGLVTGVGGQIKVDSTVGQGTIFTILLPLASAAEALEPEQVATITAPTRCRVLVVEQLPEIRGLIERILAREGFPVLTAADGEAACRALEVPGATFGLVVTGGILPGRPTGEVVRRAQAAEPDCRIIVVSDQILDGDILREIESGRFLHLRKPFDAGQLREAVSEALHRAA